MTDQRRKTLAATLGFLQLPPRSQISLGHNTITAAGTAEASTPWAATQRTAWAAVGQDAAGGSA
jgi:hypothetical protein